MTRSWTISEGGMLYDHWSKGLFREMIGTVANENPWETLHKIRNGQPGIPMPSLGVLELKDQIDILTYAQTLSKR